MLKMYSKGDFTFGQLLLLIVTIFAALIIMGIFSKVYGGEAKETLNLIDGGKDYDSDGLPNNADKCPCNEGEAANLDLCQTPTKECQLKMKAQYDAEKKRAT